MTTLRSLHRYFLAGLLFVSTFFGALSLQAQRNRAPLPTPTYANVPYGAHENQVIDFWRADIPGKGPLVVYIHGGGFTGGSKDSIGAARVERLLGQCIHVAAVEYRFLKHAKLPAAHDDAVRAIQFIRSKSNELGIDKKRIGAFGGSAGAQLVAYLAWRDDLADPDSDDPIARESTRLAAVAPLAGQASMDLDWWIENIPGYDEPHNPISAYIDLTGVAFEAMERELSIINHISPDDPPVFMSYNMKPDDRIPEENAQGWKIHHVNFGIAMEERLQKAGVEVTLKYPGPQTRYENEIDFLVDKLVWEGDRETYADFEGAVFEGSNGQELQYQLLKPTNYNPKKKYPLVVFLHGSGGRGPANIRNLLDATVPARIASKEVYGKHNAFYLVPQCPFNSQWSESMLFDERFMSRPSVQDTLLELVDETIASNSIDQRRLYITGLSMGGFGTFSVVSKRPDFWAAAVPVCGGWPVEDVGNLKGTPFRVFHGDDDKAVDVQFSRDIVAALKAANADVAYTEYPGVGHNSWLNAYWEDSLWSWMFKQKR